MNENHQLKEIMNMTSVKMKKIKLKMDRMMLDNIIAFLYKDSVLRTRKTLKNIQTLFGMIDDSVYDGNPVLKARIWVIRKSLEAKLINGFENDNMIKQYCLEDPECEELERTLINEIENFKITYDESKYLVKMIDDRVEYGYVVNLKEIVQGLFDKMTDGDYKTYKAISEDLYSIASSVINIKRNTNSLDSDQTFSLDGDTFENVVTDSVMKLKDRDKIFITGIKRLNTILSPGYMSKRLYCYLAFPGGGKSQILLKSALDIKKYNGHVKAKDPNKNPAVLFITMENDIDETVERIFNMCGNNDDIRNYTPKQVIKFLREHGDLKLTTDNNIDIIIKYYANRSIDTNDLYGIIKDLDDAGSEVIALILDYVKRIRPAERGSTEKEELKNITNELKTLAKILDIPVITAQQLNRVASSVVDAALQAKKEDVTRLVGRDGVAGAWEIIENCDWVCVINQEVKADTEDLYLTFKLLKRRYRSSEDDEKLRRLEYFNHPYEPGNSIRLMDDYDLPKSLSLLSLATQFMALEENKRGKKNVMEREKKEKSTMALEFEPFDFEVSMN